jgi:hypothetical protein
MARVESSALGHALLRAQRRRERTAPLSGVGEVVVSPPIVRPERGEPPSSARLAHSQELV